LNFDFSDEQKSFQAQVRKFLGAAANAGETRRVAEQSDNFSLPTWEGIANLGVCAAIIPEAFGGLGLSHFELCVAAEEIGRALAAVPLGLSIYFVAEAIIRYGSEGQKQRWLPRLADGSTIGAAALWEKARPMEAGAIGCSVDARGRLNGEKNPVLDGNIAQVAVALAVDRRGEPTLYLVDLRQKAVTRGNVAALDPSRPHARIQLDGASAEQLGEAGQGLMAARDLLRRASIPMAFEQLGGADRALEMACNYALQRHAFGRPIGSYQAVKQKLANVYMANQLARSHAYFGVWALANDAPELPIAAAAARVAAGDAFCLAAQENIQVHGGIGYTWDSDCHLFYRRARLLALALGPLSTSKTEIARALTRNCAA
jgi:alkylation response protein AidB-like acyl-CoA dehydrogenase